MRKQINLKRKSHLMLFLRQQLQLHIGVAVEKRVLLNSGIYHLCHNVPMRHYLSTITHLFSPCFRKTCMFIRHRKSKI